MDIGKMMKNIILFFFILITFGCVNLNQKVKNLNQKVKILHIHGGNQTAIKQDMLLAKYSKITKTDKEIEIQRKISDTLKANIWFQTARKLAPSNLTIRQLCLIDILNGSPDNFQEILSTVNLLSNQHKQGSLWVEGYSYYRYTYVALDVYIRHFYNTHPNIQKLVNSIINIQKTFGRTAYLNDSVWFPPIFSDLRYEPLQAEELRFVEEDKSITVPFLQKKILGDTTIYTSYFRPMGFNTHIFVDTTRVRVVNGKVIDFKFYEGYDKKYDKPEDEIKDMLNSKRIESLRKL